MRGEGREGVRIRKMQLKIVLVGERRVGKTSLLERYLKNHFSEEYTGTLGGRVYPTDLEVALDGDDIALAHIASFNSMANTPARKPSRNRFSSGPRASSPCSNLNGRRPCPLSRTGWAAGPRTPGR